MARSAHIFISTGEVSGDLQGSLLIQALQERAQQSQIQLHISALGGSRMAEAGAHLLGHTDRLGAIGLVESLRFVFPTLRLQRQVRIYLQAHPPDVVVLLDYPGVNLRMGAYLRDYFQVPILYYIAPQSWAIQTPTKVPQQVADLVDEVIAIFPQAAQHFAAQGAKVTWVGHPFIDLLGQGDQRSAARAQLGISAEQLAIALLPASRYQEIVRLLPILGAAAQQIQAQFPQAHFLIPTSCESYRPMIEAAVSTYGLSATLTTDARLTLAGADLALGKCGTVNLEAALLGVPQVVLYRLSPVSYWIFRYLLRYQVSFISPVNLMLDEAAVPELLQRDATPDRLADAALQLLCDGDQRQRMQDAYTRLRAELGAPGSLGRAAERVLAYL